MRGEFIFSSCCCWDSTRYSPLNQQARHWNVINTKVAIDLLDWIDPYLFIPHLIRICTYLHMQMLEIYSEENWTCLGIFFCSLLPLFCLLGVIIQEEKKTKTFLLDCELCLLQGCWQLMAFVSSLKVIPMAQEQRDRITREMASFSLLSVHESGTLSFSYNHFFNCSRGKGNGKGA